MTNRERLGLALLRRIDPERSHALSLLALRSGLAPLPGPVATQRLATTLAGMPLLNPVGLAAGYDKNATAIGPLSRAGFGFLEVGAATPLPQPGNDRPRLFRLTEDRAAINRFGFNNQGMEAIARRLSARAPGPIPVGPNTEGLRNLQGRVMLAGLLQRVMETRLTLARPIPVFLKIAPDLSAGELEDIVEVALAAKVAGIIATNTTLSREGLKSARRDQSGGLSGAPLFEKSTRVLARLSQLTHGTLPLIGVGGVGSAEDAYQKIRAGASAVQLYTAMVYQGLSLVPRIARGLDALLARDGFARIALAVGTGRSAWL